MYMNDTDISCGIAQIYQIGSKPNKKKFAAILYDYIADYYPGDLAMIIASLTTKQKPGIKFMKEMGFKQIGKARKNPNSGNDILLFKKDITDKDRKKYKMGKKYRVDNW